jgi:hypothetical protein
LNTRTIMMPSPLPWGEGGPLPAHLRAGAGRVRGLFMRDGDRIPSIVIPAFGRCRCGVGRPQPS